MSQMPIITISLQNYFIVDLFLYVSSNDVYYHYYSMFYLNSFMAQIKNLLYVSRNFLLNFFNLMNVIQSS
jgi:hypothetical protein